MLKCRKQRDLLASGSKPYKDRDSPPSNQMAQKQMGRPGIRQRPTFTDILQEADRPSAATRGLWLHAKFTETRTGKQHAPVARGYRVGHRFNFL